MDEETRFQAGIAALNDLKTMIKLTLSRFAQEFEADCELVELDFSYGRNGSLRYKSRFQAGVGLAPYLPLRDWPGFELKIIIIDDLPTGNVPKGELLRFHYTWVLDDEFRPYLEDAVVTFGMFAREQLPSVDFESHWALRCLRAIDAQVFEGDLFRTLDPDKNAAAPWVLLSHGPDLILPGGAEDQARIAMPDLTMSVKEFREALKPPYPMQQLLFSWITGDESRLDLLGRRE